MTISQDDLRGLSAVERDALLSTDEDDEDLVRELGLPVKAADATESTTVKAAKADEAEEEGEGDDDQAAAATTAAPAPAPAVEAAPAPAPAAEAETASEDADDTPGMEVLQRNTPADVAEQRKALRTERADAMEKLLAGEIDRTAFSEIEDRVNDKLDALVRAEASDQARVQIQQDSMMADYNRELKDSHKGLRAAGLDLATVGPEFDRAVRMFAAEAGARGLTDAPGNLAASKAALADAAEYLLRRHGKTAAPAAPTPAAKAPAAPARQAKPVDRSTFPPTLANVPVAADASITSEFAHLDGLAGSSLERALAKLTPDQQERYLG